MPNWRPPQPHIHQHSAQQPSRHNHLLHRQPPAARTNGAKTGKAQPHFFGAASELPRRPHPALFAENGPVTAAATSDGNPWVRKALLERLRAAGIELDYDRAVAVGRLGALAQQACSSALDKTAAMRVPIDNQIFAAILLGVTAMQGVGAAFFWPLSHIVQ